MGGEVSGDASPEKIRNLRSSNCWKCTEIVNLTITVLFFYHLNILRSHQADLLVLGGGGGGACAPSAPPCLRAWWTAILDAPLGFCRRRPRFRICRNSNGQKLSSNTLSTQLPNVLSNYLICFNLGALYKMFTF